MEKARIVNVFNEIRWIISLRSYENTEILVAETSLVLLSTAGEYIDGKATYENGSEILIFPSLRYLMNCNASK